MTIEALFNGPAGWGSAPVGSRYRAGQSSRERHGLAAFHRDNFASLDRDRATGRRLAVQGAVIRAALHRHTHKCSETGSIAVVSVAASGRAAKNLEKMLPQITHRCRLYDIRVAVRTTSGPNVAIHGSTGAGVKLAI